MLWTIGLWQHLAMPCRHVSRNDVSPPPGLEGGGGAALGQGLFDPGASLSPAKVIVAETSGLISFECSLTTDKPDCEASPLQVKFDVNRVTPECHWNTLRTCEKRSRCILRCLELSPVANPIDLQGNPVPSFLPMEPPPAVDLVKRKWEIGFARWKKAVGVSSISFDIPVSAVSD